MSLNPVPGDSHSSSESETEDTRPDAGGKFAVPTISAASQRRQAQLEKIKLLRNTRNDARKMNRQAVQEEDRLSKLPSNHGARQERAQWKLDEIVRKEKAAGAAEDYDLVKLREVQADHAESKQVKKNNKKDPDQGWTSWADCSSRTYRKQVKDKEPNWKEYAKEKERLGEAFYATLNTQMEVSRKDSPNALNKLSEAIDSQQQKRAKFHRRRTYNEDDHINFINERNRKFNAKAERAYGQYSTEIRDSFERGTAL
jgi:pre-mRNA-splicing factor SYF2